MRMRMGPFTSAFGPVIRHDRPRLYFPVGSLLVQIMSSPNRFSLPSSHNLQQQQFLSFLLPSVISPKFLKKKKINKTEYRKNKEIQGTFCAETWTSFVYALKCQTAQGNWQQVKSNLIVGVSPLVLLRPVQFWHSPMHPWLEFLVYGPKFGASLCNIIWWLSFSIGTRGKMHK